MKFRVGLPVHVDDDNYFQTDIRTEADVSFPFLSLNTEGVLHIKPGYSCDGCSGPTRDIPSKWRPKWLNKLLMKVLPG